MADAKSRNALPRRRPHGKARSHRSAGPQRQAEGEALLASRRRGARALVLPTGVKSWQLRYALHGKGQTATLGKLGKLPMPDARAKANELRKLAADGEHLTTVKRHDRLQRKADAANTFGVVKTRS